MIEILCGRDASGFIRRLASVGHSGYAQAGEDIVCAAVSALTQTAAIAFEEMEIGVTQVDEEAALLTIELPSHLPLNEMHDAQVILRTIIGGLAAIAEEYPDYVSIREV